MSLFMSCINVVMPFLCAPPNIRIYGIQNVNKGSIFTSMHNTKYCIFIGNFSILTDLWGLVKCFTSKLEINIVTTFQCILFMGHILFLKYNLVFIIFLFLLLCSTFDFRCVQKIRSRKSLLRCTVKR